PPRRSAQVIVPSMSPAELDDLKSIAPDIGLVFCPSEAEPIEQVAGAIACYGSITRDVIRAGKSLRWLRQPSVGVERLMEIPEPVRSDIVPTSLPRTYAPEIAH